MKRLWRWAGLAGLLLVAAIMVVFFTASSWLETPAGRDLIQRELGQGLGVQADMQGDYALELFPGLQIAGRQLELRDLESGTGLASLQSYQLHLALWPLLEKRIVIFKVAAGDGFIDLDLLLGQDDAQARRENESRGLPTIQSLQLTGLEVLKSGTALLRVDHLQLDDFAAGRDAALSLGVSLPSDPAAASLLEVSGGLRVEPALLSAALDLEAASIRIAGRAWPFGPGRLAWSGTTGDISGLVQAGFAGYGGELEFRVVTQPGLTARLDVRLSSPDRREVAAGIMAQEAAEAWLLQPVDLQLDGQQLHGQGCLELAGQPRLQLELHADELDLEQLRNLLPAGLPLGGDGAASSAASLPLDLAVELQAGQVTMAGATAKDVRLLLGEAPDCSAAYQAISR